MCRMYSSQSVCVLSVTSATQPVAVRMLQSHAQQNVWLSNVHIFEDEALGYICRMSLLRVSTLVLFIYIGFGSSSFT